MFKNISAFTLLLAILFTAGNLHGESVFISGYARNYTGMLLNDTREYSIVQNTFDLKFEHSRNSVAFKANPYFYQYFDKDLKIGLREAYLDILFDKMDIRMGKQQIIWGKADGVFITDIISPKNLSEFLLPDFDEIRMGVTALKADYYLGDHTFEAVWIPAFSATVTPDTGSIWYKTLSFPIAPIFDDSHKEITPSLQNSELFGKFSAMTSLIDFEVMGGYAWDDDPTMHIQKSINPATQQLSGITLLPQHHRLSIGGGSFSTTVGAFVLRGEGAYYSGKYFLTDNPTAIDGITDKNYLHYLFGVDFNIGDTRISSQFIQQTILDYDEYLKNDEFENTATVLISRTFMRETLKIELFSYIGLTNEDALIRPKLTYDFTDGFQFLLGVNIFTGKDGRFAQYDDNDMIYFKVRYSF
ncbi:MAG TPA: hypothetical protein DHW42_10865 [Candidatus Marinimicrobia bacterium]|nr:hypothetical protein [Candidatus Neomarinimicrobiota bacterium]